MFLAFKLPITSDYPCHPSLSLHNIIGVFFEFKCNRFEGLRQTFAINLSLLNWQNVDFVTFHQLSVESLEARLIDKISSSRQIELWSFRLMHIWNLIPDFLLLLLMVFRWNSNEGALEWKNRMIFSAAILDNP